MEILNGVTLTVIFLVFAKTLIGFHFPWETCPCCGKKYREHNTDGTPIDKTSIQPRTLASLSFVEVNQLAKTMTSQEKFSTDDFSRKIARIKAVRTLIPEATLKDAKSWVEMHF